MTSGYKSLIQTAPTAGGGGGIGVGSQMTLRVAKLFWESPATIGDTFVIMDPISSLVLWNGTCEVALQSQVFDWTARPLLWADFKVSTIASGTLYISLI